MRPRARASRDARPLRGGAACNVKIVSEKVGDSLKITIGPRVRWLGVFTVLALISILSGVGVSPAYSGLKLALNNGGSIGGYIIGIAACAGLILFLLYSLILNLFGSEMITVSSTELELQWLICGFVRSKRSFPNSTVEKLRFEEWAGRARGDGMHSGIRFDCVGETVTFAGDLPEKEAGDLIDQLRKVYAFAIPDPPQDEPSPAVTNW
jgi:hypothetical protein